ncbi:uncharacterized protein LOC129577125 isoform X2 [Sitodiplosis mosellana]|uniref:uncharacterized protein LOC129577125 isoform X2 n=1 Tax=Sitodiplosis mosellana TaxID=263140 RepID=UPI0024444BBE|nr:uncharacterized protein LOC129577125 isoform X2 [Sitodiplosis mosellana]
MFLVNDFIILLVTLTGCGVQTAHANYFGNCDYYVQLDANEGKSVINPGGYVSILGYFGYFGFFDPGSACRYFIECPRNYVIRLYCYLNIAVTGEGNDCKTEQFRVLDDGTNQILDRGTYFCGQGVVKIQSRANFITFGHTSSYYSGRYNCTLVSMFRNPFSIT